MPVIIKVISRKRKSSFLSDISIYDELLFITLTRELRLLRGNNIITSNIIIIILFVGHQLCYFRFIDRKLIKLFN